MNIQKLTDKELLRETEALVKKEKALTIEVLRHLKEIEKRLLYSDLGYSSLFTYCTDHLGYSGNETHCRISAMRLMVDSPVVERALEQGELSLTNAALAFSHIKEEEKSSGEKLNPEKLQQKKEEVVQELLGKTTREAQDSLNKKKGKEKPKTLKITLGAQTIEKLNEFKSLCGDSSDEEIFALLLEEKLKKLRAAKQPKKSRVPTQTDTRYIPASVKAQVRARSQNQCEFVAHGKRCQERRYLQYDHIRPFTLGGQSTLDNLRHYCWAHNMRGAMKTFGVEKIRAKMKSSRQGPIA